MSVFYAQVFLKVFIIALLFSICVYSLNVLAVSYLRIIMYDCVCMGDAENARHEIAGHENAAPECKAGKCET